MIEKRRITRWEKSGKIKIAYPNPRNHSNGVLHPKTETYGPTPVPIPAKMGNHLNMRPLIDPTQSLELPVLFEAKDMVYLVRSSIILITINPRYPKWDGTGYSCG